MIVAKYIRRVGQVTPCSEVRLMNRTMAALLAVTAVMSAAACNKGNEQQTATDTTTIRAADTVAGRAVPTTDTVVKTTTTTTDTLQGKVNKDSVKDNAGAMKSKIDSTADAKKAKIDSVAAAKKAAIDKKKKP
jgi:asparagine N-glycosylation enzyme membrane subunit Stt3